MTKDRKRVLVYTWHWWAGTGCPTISKTLEIPLNSEDASLHAGLLGKTAHNTAMRGFVGKTSEGTEDEGEVWRPLHVPSLIDRPVSSEEFVSEAEELWSLAFHKINQHRESRALPAGMGMVMTCPTHPGLFNTSWFPTLGPLEPNFVIWSQQIHQGIVSKSRVTCAFPLTAPSCQRPVRGHNDFLCLHEIVKHSKSAKWMADWKILILLTPSYRNPGNGESHRISFLKGKTHWYIIVIEVIYFRQYEGKDYSSIFKNPTTCEECFIFIFNLNQSPEGHALCCVWCQCYKAREAFGCAKHFRPEGSQHLEVSHSLFLTMTLTLHFIDSRTEDFEG